jgi:hypothetical protein
MGFTNKILKDKLYGGTAGEFSNWLTFGSISKGTDEWEEERPGNGKNPLKSKETMMDALTKRARARNLGARAWWWGLL